LETLTRKNSAVQTGTTVPRSAILKTIAKHRVSAQFMRFIVAGFIATAFDFGMLVALKNFAQWSYLAANAVSFMIGNIVSYAVCVMWVFDSRNMESRTAEFGVFALIGCVALGVSQTCMYCMVGLMGFHYLVAKTTSVGFTLVVNFTGKKLLLFRDRAG
jgi:putative flippase GtrA